MFLASSKDREGKRLEKHSTARMFYSTVLMLLQLGLNVITFTVGWVPAGLVIKFSGDTTAFQSVM